MCTLLPTLPNIPTLPNTYNKYKRTQNHQFPTRVLLRRLERVYKMNDF